MSKLRYKTWTPKPEALEVVGVAEAICTEYAAQGYNLTLRQLYYQFVARGLIPNTQSSYSRLGSIINDARLAGLLDWDYIVDRTRNLAGASHFDRPQDAILQAARSYSEDLWRNQPARLEVWVEKEALADVVGQVASRHDVDYFSCRGYVSQSELWSAGQRCLDRILRGQQVIVLHLGDHDPSGIDMTRDITDRMTTFLVRDYHRACIGAGLEASTTVGAIRTHMNRRVGGEAFEVRRIALNMDQVDRYQPPPNPAKVTDSRYESYRAEFGDESWELDALEPQVLDRLIESHILAERDDETWELDVAHEEEGRASLVRIAEGGGNS